jgi:hypothetical protein
MKTTIFKISFLLLLFALAGGGCEKDKVYFPDPDPAKAILGKWEIIQMGSEPVKNPSGYKEYLADSILREYDSKTGNLVFTKKYWIDSLLHEGISREDGFLLTFEYKYQFNENKLILEYNNMIAWYNTFIYQRIK